MMTCTDFQAILPDYLEAHALTPARRSAADLHTRNCAECAALVADLRAIVRTAGKLPPLTPSRDLWSRIESQIESPVVALPGTLAENVDASSHPAAAAPNAPAMPPTWRRMAIAASLLVAATAGVTYTITTRAPGYRAAPDSVSAVRDPASVVRPASHASASETFDPEIASLRKLVDDRRGELDPVTVGVVEKNLKLIDGAIAESKDALAKDPASAFLIDRLTHAYETKLQMMRALAIRPMRS